MLGKTYTVGQLLEAQQILITARQELDDEQQRLVDEQKRLTIDTWDNKLHAEVLKTIFNEESTFTMSLPAGDVLNELKKRNPDLDIAPTSEPNQLKVTILTE